MRLRTESVTWREIDGEMVILDLSSSTYLKTNQAGSTLMRLLAEDRSLGDLVDGLMDAYGISEEDAAKDAGAFVGMLRERDLLEVVD
ncbi:PqqD family protein [Phytoactinopolyspora endophytica]|uniref:PqqD family protein n=1 Tax=Phytoactinopolyspora endophytica TaxID=1642495 RepID=UPI00101BC120|nr:PqqD family protein [Phytoactinopolyspora endophytica]